MKSENPLILHIETSTNVCSVAVSKGEQCIFTVSCDRGQSHAAMLSIFVEQALQVIKNQKNKPDAIAVSAGPGSYTGLRIGVSTAKGLCFGYEIPLIVVDTLQVMCVEANKKIETLYAVPLLCPMIDARRMEVYCAVYQKDGEIFMPARAEIVNEQSFADILAEKTVYFFGNGAEKCQNILQHKNAVFLDNISPFAENMITLAAKHFTNNNFVDVAYFEPFYLKEFQATVPKKLL